MSKFYNAQYVTTPAPAPAPAPRLRLHLREVLANPQKYFRIDDNDGVWFSDPDNWFQPGPGLIEAIKSAVDRKIHGDYYAALSPFSTMPRQVWDWLWEMDKYAVAYLSDPSWEFYDAPLSALSTSELRRLRGGIEAFQRLDPALDLLDWWTGSDTRNNTPWEDKAADDLRAAYLKRIKQALSAKLKAEAEARTLAQYEPRPLTHRPFAAALTRLAA